MPTGNLAGQEGGVAILLSPLCDVSSGLGVVVWIDTERGVAPPNQAGAGWREPANGKKNTGNRVGIH